MKATGIVRRVDDLGRIVIPKEIRRTLRIREGDPLHTTLTPFDKFCWAIHSVGIGIMNQRGEFHLAGLNRKLFENIFFVNNDTVIYKFFLQF